MFVFVCTSFCPYQGLLNELSDFVKFVSIKLRQRRRVCCFNVLQFKDENSNHFCAAVYEGVSKSPRTMLITFKSLVFHEFPARVCCGAVL